MLEAGPLLDPAKHYTEHLWPYQLSHRGAGIGGSGMNASGSYELDVAHIAGSIEGEPYSERTRLPVSLDARPHPGRPNQSLELRRSAFFGARFAHAFAERLWRRLAHSLRRSRALLRSRRIAHRRSRYPRRPRGAPDGIFLPPPVPRCSDRLIQNGSRKLRVPCIAGRAAVITQPHNGRPACHYCAQCTQGCHTASRFSASQVLLPAALKTGKLTLMPDAMAREILLDKTGKVAGAHTSIKAPRRNSASRPAR